MQSSKGSRRSLAKKKRHTCASCGAEIATDRDPVQGKYFCSDEFCAQVAKDHKRSFHSPRYKSGDPYFSYGNRK